VEANAYQGLMQQRIETVFQTADAETAALDMVDIVAVFVDETRRLLKADRSSVFLVNKATSEINTTKRSGDEGERVMIRLPIGQGIAGECALTGEEILITNAYEDDRFDSSIDKNSGYKTDNLLCMPITGSTGEVLGVVQMINKQGGFTIADSDLLRSLVAKATLAIEKAQLFGDLKGMMDANSLMNAELDLDSLMEQVMNQAQKILKADRCTLLLHDSKTNTLWSRVASGLGDEKEKVRRGSVSIEMDSEECIRIPVDAGIAGSVFQTRATLNVPDAYAHPKFNQDTDKATGYKTQSVLAMPVMTAAGDVIGVIQMVNKQDATNKTVVPFTLTDEHVMKAFVVHAAVALTNSQVFQTTMATMTNLKSLLNYLPEYMICVNDKGEYKASSRPLSTILRAHEDDVELKSDTGMVVKFDTVSSELAADIQTVLATNKPINRPSAEFLPDSLTCGPCRGYVLVPSTAVHDATNFGAVVTIRASWLTDEVAS